VGADPVLRFLALLDAKPAELPAEAAPSTTRAQLTKVNA
jgi:hypothetical protein